MFKALLKYKASVLIHEYKNNLFNVGNFLCLIVNR